jgi:hypothetical protein
MTMSALSRWLLRKPFASAQRKAVRLGCESLEQRDVPSTVYSRDFNPATSATLAPGVTANWSHTQKNPTPTGNYFLGEFGNQSVTFTLNGLPAHESVNLAFDLYLIRTWDGNDTNYGPDSWSVSTGGSTLLSSTFRNWRANGPNDTAAGQSQNFGGVGVEGGPFNSATGASSVNSLGYTFTNDKGTQTLDSVYKFSFPVEHTGSSISFTFTGSGLQGLSDESWGLDNVVVTATPPRPTVSVASIADASESQLDNPYGVTDGAFRVSRTGSTASDLKVTLASPNPGSGAYAGDDDYESFPHTVTIPAGKGYVDVALTPKKDNLVEEGGEKIRLAAIATADYKWDGATSYLTIADDPPVVTVSASPNAHEAGDTPYTVTQGKFQFIRSGGDLSEELAIPITFLFVPLEHPAEIGVDFEAETTVTFGEGSTEEWLAITPKKDNLVEGDEDGNETIMIQLGGDNYIGAGEQVSMNLGDDPPVVTVAKYQDGAEENTLSAIFEFTRSGGDPMRQLNVYFELSGKASNETEPHDLVGPLPSSVTFPEHGSEGQWWKSRVAIVPVDDLLTEGVEHVSLSIVQGQEPIPNYISTSSSAADATIADNDIEISGRFWHDANGDGEQGSGESPVVGAEVHLQTEAGGKLLTVASTVTDVDGRYTLAGAADTAYQVSFVSPGESPAAFTIRDAAPDDRDSDADEGGKVPVAPMPGGEKKENVGAGLRLKIASVAWVKKAGDTGAAIDAQPEGAIGGGKRVFVEKATPTSMAVQNQVEVHATISEQRANIDVFFYIYDVDDPSSNSPTDTTLDDESKSTDNRGAALLGKFSVKTNEQGVAIATRTLSQQPGDNFRVVATTDPGFDLEAGVVVRQKDATAGVYFSGAGGAAVPASDAMVVTSELATVWRHLYIERDHMKAPPPGEVFDGTEPRKDVAPGGPVADPGIALATEQMRSAYIEVVEANTGLNPRTESNWVHNLGGGELTDVDSILALVGQVKIDLAAIPESSRDIRGSEGFWSIQIVAAYEGSVLEDMDPMAGAPGNLPDYDSWTMGVGATPPAGASDASVFVFTETVRDAFTGRKLIDYKWSAVDSAWKIRKSEDIGLASEDQMLQRVVYHEILHPFGMLHEMNNPLTNEGIHDISAMYSGTNADIMLTDWQKNKLRSATKPSLSAPGT